MLSHNEATTIRRICLHLLACKGGPCHDVDGVERRRQTATLVLTILDGGTE